MPWVLCPGVRRPELAADYSPPVVSILRMNGTVLPPPHIQYSRITVFRVFACSEGKLPLSPLLLFVPNLSFSTSWPTFLKFYKLFATVGHLKAVLVDFLIQY